MGLLPLDSISFFSFLLLLFFAGLSENLGKNLHWCETIGVVKNSFIGIIGGKDKWLAGWFL